jgi:hypothetical protein
LSGRGGAFRASNSEWTLHTAGYVCYARVYLPKWCGRSLLLYFSKLATSFIVRHDRGPFYVLLDFGCSEVYIGPVLR